MELANVDPELVDDYQELLSTETSELVQQLMDEYTSRKRPAEHDSELESFLDDEDHEQLSDSDVASDESVVRDTESDSSTTGSDDSDEEFLPYSYQKNIRKAPCRRKRSLRSANKKKTRPRITTIPTIETATKLSYRNCKRRRLPDALKALLGQAAVCYASGKMDDVIGMCQEVIRLQPDHHAGYTLMSAAFKEQGQMDKGLEYGILGAMLNGHTDLNCWKTLASTAIELNQPLHALTCYEKAVKLDRKNLSLYNTIFQLNASLGRMNRMLQAQIKAVQELMFSSDMQLEEYLEFVESIYKKCCTEKKRRGKLKCLKCYIIRGQSAGIDCSGKLADYLQQLFEQHQYFELILATCAFTPVELFLNGRQVEITSSNFRSSRIDKVKTPSDYPASYLMQTVVAWFALKEFDRAKHFLNCFMQLQALDGGEPYYTLIADAMLKAGYLNDVLTMIERLLPSSPLEHSGNTDLLVKYGDALSSLGKTEDAMKTFEHIIALEPRHALARLNLATLQQKHGLYEDAMRTLDLFDGKEVEDVGFLDDRLLVEQCTILEKKCIWAQYVVSGTSLLAMYFKDVYSPTCFSRLKNRLSKRSLNLRKVVLFTLRRSKLEKLVKRSVTLRNKHISSEELWHIFDKICNLYLAEERYLDLLHLCCYGSQSLAVATGETIDNIDSTLLYAAIHCRAPQLIWNIVRYGMQFENCNHFWNFIGFICLMIPDVRIHRFALRSAANYPDSIGLAFINGNHSLVAGSYQYALLEYFFILRRSPADPLVCLLIGVTLINIASRRGILQKCDCCMQGFAFLAKYEEIRGSCQEVSYNMGRAMQQMGVLNVAVEYYKRTLEMEPDVASPCSSMFDLRPLAAHNLICMYNQSNNVAAARDLMQKYLLV
uniref:General transcription factor 3C polypeptide 3 n=1 Tax=Trichuris muris TaxID=70415 RepID=A0A5S6QEF8_TRIMR